MAEEEAGAHVAGKGMEAFTRKLGPFPVWVWGVGLAAAIYLLRKRFGGGGGGQSTDPAGNVGTIDPATGYVYGTPQDQAGLAAQNSTSTNNTSQSGSTVGGQYPDNASWGRAAVNYLVSLGEDPTGANEAVQQFLSSQTLTPPQQAMVNLAVQGIGPPPTLPGPTGTPPPPINNPPSGIVYATNPPTGLTVSGKSGSTITVKWNAATNATGYTVRYGRTSSAGDGSVSVPSGNTTATIGGLTPGTLYYVTVQATPAKDSSAFASTSAETDFAGVGGPPVFHGGTPVGGGGSPPSGGGGGSYTVVQGDTLIGIGNKVHLDWHTLYNNNKATIEDAAHSHGHSSSSNGNLLFPGTVLHD